MPKRKPSKTWWAVSLAYLGLLLMLAFTPADILARFWFLTAFLYLPPIFYFVLPVALAIPAWRRRSHLGTATVFLGWTTSYLLLALPLLGNGRDVQGVGSTVRVLSWNIQDGTGGLDRLMELARQSEADILLLQECVSSRRQLEDLFPSYHLAADAGSEVVVLSRYPLREIRDLEFTDRGVFTKVNSPIGPLSLSCLHLEKGPRYSWAPFLPAIRTTFRAHETMASSIESLLADEFAVVGGDFNAPPSSPLVRRFAARSAYRQAGTGIGATFPAKFPVWQIDHVLLGEKLRCRSISVEETTLSDHRPLILEIEMAP